MCKSQTVFTNSLSRLVFFIDFSYIQSCIILIHIMRINEVNDNMGTQENAEVTEVMWDVVMWQIAIQ